MKSERIILGIDPGTNIMGYGLIRQMGSKVELVSLGVIQLNKYNVLINVIKLREIILLMRS